MDNQKETELVLDQLIMLYEKYSNIYRASTQPYKLEVLKKRYKNYEYHHEDLVIRESLIEHVGSLPIIASTIYPYLGDHEVDLGRSLALLSVHDIGELVVGDKIAFIKGKDDGTEEKKEALGLLHPSLHDLYNEMQDQKTKTAKFAKAIDKMTPDILDLITPAELTLKRYKGFLNKEPKELIPMIIEYKRPFMTWNKFLTDLHILIMERAEKKWSEYY